MNTPGTAPAELRSFVERIQRLEGEIADINSDKRDVYTEAKSKGFDVAALKAVVAYLRKDREKAEEQRTVFDLYLAQVVAPVGTGNATRARTRATQLAASTSNPPTRGDEAAPRKSPAATGAASPISDESRANARDEAMPQDSPQGVGKVERASRLVTGRTVTPGRDGRTPAPISEAAPALGVVGGDRTDAASSHSAVSTQPGSSQADGGGNLAGEPRASSGGVPGHLLFTSDAISPTAPHPMLKPTTKTSGHSLSETDAVVLPGSIVEPAVVEVSIPSDEIEPVSDPGLPAGSPISDLEPRGGVESRHTGNRAGAASCANAKVCPSAGVATGPRVLDTDPSLDIRNQPFYRGGETWPR
jgi:uncharacterized protein (UPF0335 family)